MPDSPLETYFTFFNEVGIIGQLSRTLLERHLPKGYLLPHFSVLNHLIRVRDGPTPLALARAFQVPKTSMTHTLAGLERGGLIEMRQNPEDKRSKCVWLMPAGRAFRDDAIAALAPDVARISGQIDASRLTEIVPELVAIRKILDTDRNG